MRYLLIFAIVLVLGWRWRIYRNAKTAQVKPPQHPPVGGPITVVQCRHCGVHVQPADLIAGTKGSYCSLEHRALAEP